MRATSTRTVNPLPFQDLEPHRFEDLVRQLAYDFREWKALEPIGRSGSDEGQDIRAIEVVRLEREHVDDQVSEPEAEERVWLFQCKRERTFGPKQVQRAVDEAFRSLAIAPHGFVLAVACDVSKKSRDRFREEMVRRGVKEFVVWAKGELEDLLFQAENDRLLFAYFGLSLQPKRRSIAAAVRARIATKKQVAALLEETRGKLLVLLRDPSDDRYPDEPGHEEQPKRWIACSAISLSNPDKLTVLHREFLAAVTPDGRRWDIIREVDIAQRDVQLELQGKRALSVPADSRPDGTARGFWEEFIPDDERALLKELRYVPLDRIVAIDPMGDAYFPVPHLFVEWDAEDGPFGSSWVRYLEGAGRHRRHPLPRPEKGNRVQIFPIPLPQELDPPPAHLDDTRPTGTPLSAEAEEKIRAVISTCSEGVSTASERKAPGQQTSVLFSERLERFRSWRERVALPTFSTVVHRLRAAGQSSRVVVRSRPGTPDDGEAMESVELRVRLRRADAPGFRSTGYVRVSCTWHLGWGVAVDPAPEEVRGRRGEVPSGSDEEMESAALEGRVVSMLQRLQSRGY